MPRKNYKTISISLPLYDTLKEMCHIGQSINGFLQEVIPKYLTLEKENALLKQELYGAMIPKEKE